MAVPASLPKDAATSTSTTSSSSSSRRPPHTLPSMPAVFQRLATGARGRLSTTTTSSPSSLPDVARGASQSNGPVSSSSSRSRIPVKAGSTVSPKTVTAKGAQPLSRTQTTAVKAAPHAPARAEAPSKPARQTALPSKPARQTALPSRPARSTPMPAPRAQASKPAKPALKPKPRTPALPLASTFKSTVSPQPKIAKVPVRREPPALLLKSAIKTVRLDVRPSDRKVQWGAPDTPEPTVDTKQIESRGNRFVWVNRTPIRRRHCTPTVSNFDLRYGGIGEEDSGDARAPPPTQLPAEELVQMAKYDAIYFPGNISELVNYKPRFMGEDRDSILDEPRPAQAYVKLFQAQLEEITHC